nr:carbamoyl-phosphate synthase large subunit [Actinomycetota bacterium]
MPRRDDIHRILLLGSGPIVIGQAAEFDYSGTQACKVLREEGYEVVLVNSNPATIMTDPEFADATYVEPLLPGAVTQVIEKERPDALLPTLGGQTALNLARVLHEDGTLERHGVELIGADYGAIARAEDRDLFRETMAGAGLRVPHSAIATTLAEAQDARDDIGLPIVVRPAFTLGGWGGGVAHTPDEFRHIVSQGLAASPIGQVLLDESVLGWGEFELEVMRDSNDNVVIVCSIENLDPMGVHTGDSVCVAPQQTLTDRQYQVLRDQAIAAIRAVGVETGGSNVQFAVNPATDEVVVIEMNPRVSRSSALASKATGFPIAKIAARLAVGYALEEIDNDITKRTPASFEPTIDYAVVKWPRFAFEKFPGIDGELTTHMKSVGEVMAIGRTFQQAFAKAMRSRELDAVPRLDGLAAEELVDRAARPSAERFDAVLEALRRGAGVEDLHARTSIDPWFLRELAELAAAPDPPFAGERVFKSVDTCAAEFEAETPYYYSSWERSGASEVRRGERPSVVILGAGPNRIGQGIEFDYCCVHAAMEVRDSGRDAVMVNCNPETVSTDYDTSHRLYFEPLTLEDVLGVIEVERPEGVVVTFGGQTPLKLAAGLEAAGAPLLGTSVDSIDLAEDRGRFGALLRELGLQAPPYATAHSVDEALARAGEVGFPLLVRPSYVLGGRAMEIVYDEEGLRDYLARQARVTGPASPTLPASRLRSSDCQETAPPVGHVTREIYLDRFLENAIEVDVDALCDSEEAWVGGVMQHVEEAGIHSGDSACVLPPHSLGEDMLDEIRAQTRAIALGLRVVGLLNVQFAVHGEELYVIEANPRASRTVPFVSKATGVPLARLACRIMLGARLADLDLPEARPLGHVSVKEAVLPFDRFAGADPLMGPEMRSTGEVMGVAADFPTAFAKAQAAAGAQLPVAGTVFITVTDTDKPAASTIAAQF